VEIIFEGMIMIERHFKSVIDYSIKHFPCVVSSSENITALSEKVLVVSVKAV